MDAPDGHAEAHAKFEALAMEQVDEAQLTLFEGLAMDIPHNGGLGAELAGKIAALASECKGELVYEFSIWKDNVVEVADRVVQVLDRAMVDEFGANWRDLKLPSAALFVYAYADLGFGSVSRFDLTPTLRRRCPVKFDLFLNGRDDQGADEEDDLQIDTSRFESFTKDLMAAHEECQPEAFSCHDGGRGSIVLINGLKGRPELNGLAGKILGPVNLESGRWPVELSDGQGKLSVRTQNLLAAS